MNKIEGYEQFLLNTRAEVRHLQQKMQEKTQRVQELNLLVGDLIEAQDVLNVTGALAQEEFEGFIENMVTEALQMVFGSEYVFEMQTDIVRNQPETQFYLVENENRIPIKDDMVGGGMLDLISMVLRVVIWSIHEHRTRPVMILDEPGKNLDRSKIDLFIEMIRKFHELLGIQFIIVTHDNKIIEMADRAFRVNRVDGTANVTVVK